MTPLDTEAALRRLESLGAIVKPFRVAEFDLEGIVVRLGDEHNPDERMITRNGRIATAVLAELPRVPSLLLEIRGPALADEGLAPLAGLEHLIGLDLSGTRVTGAGMKAVAKCHSLRLLDLSFTSVEDRSLADLTSLQSLGLLSVLGTKVTAEGVKVFAGRRGLKIVR